MAGEGYCRHMADDLSPATFAPTVGTVFSIGLDGPPHTLELTLDQLVEHTPSPQSPRAQPFTLFFVGPAGGHLPQRTYALQHATLGTVELFIVPIGPRPDGRHVYEAVFN